MLFTVAKNPQDPSADSSAPFGSVAVQPPTNRPNNPNDVVDIFSGSAPGTTRAGANTDATQSTQVTRPTNQPAEGRPQPSSTASLNRAFAQSTAGHVQIQALQRYQLPKDLSATQLRQFLADVRKVVRPNGQVIGEQNITVPLEGNTHGVPFKTSGDVLYGERANDAAGVLTQTELYALLASAAERLAELEPTSVLAGSKQKELIKETGEGAGEVVSLLSFDSDKGRAGFEELLEKTTAVAEVVAQKEAGATQADQSPQETLAETTTAPPKEVEPDTLASTQGGESSAGDFDAGGGGERDEATPPPTPETKPQETEPQEKPPEKPPTKTEPTPAKSQALTDDPHLVALLTERFTLDYMGGLVTPGDIPPQLSQELQTSIAEHLSHHYTPEQLEALRYSPTLYKQAVARLSGSLANTPAQATARTFLEQYAKNPAVSAAQQQEILKLLQQDSTLQSFDTTNPYHDFVMRANKIVGTDNAGALFTANLSVGQTALEASILAIGSEKTQKLLATASPEQLRSLLNIPSSIKLSNQQLEMLRVSAVGTAGLLATKLVYETQTEGIRGGILAEKTTQKTGNFSTPKIGIIAPYTNQNIDSREPNNEQENLEKLGPHAAGAIAHSPRKIQKNLERVQKLLQGNWDSLDPKLQRFIYTENGVTLPPNLHPADSLPFTTAFIQYTQRNIEELQKNLDRLGIQDVRQRAQVATTLQTSREFVDAQIALANQAVIGKALREEYLAALGPAAAYATHAVGLASIGQTGEFGSPNTWYLSPEDVQQLSGLSAETDFNSFYELLQSSEYLAQNPQVFGEYNAAHAGSQGFLGRLRQSLARYGKMPSRAQALRQSVANTARRIKELRQLGTSLAGSLAGNPLAMAQLAKNLFTTKTGRTILAVGAGASLLPALPGLIAALNAASWLQNATSSVGNALSSLGGGSGGATAGGAATGAGGVSPGTTAGATPSATAAGASTEGGLTGATITGAGIPVQTTGFAIFSSFSGVMFSSFFGFVVFSVFITLLVINAAFLIPTPTSTTPDFLRGNSPSESLYLKLHKKPLETKFENDVDALVHYTVTITPKSPYQIEIVSISDTYSFFGEGDRSKLEGLTSPITKENFPAGQFAEATAQSYSVTMNAVDTLVTNTFSLTYNVYDTTGTLVKADQKISNAATIMIGKVTGGCFEFLPGGRQFNSLNLGRPVLTQEWKETEKLLIFQAFARRVGNNPRFISLLCSAGPINLGRVAGNAGGEQPEVGTLLFLDQGLGGIDNTEYTLVHELGHELSSRNPVLFASFKTVLRNTHCMSYPLRHFCKPGEAFAESVVLGAVYKTKYFSAFSGTYDFPSRDPAEYAWIIENIYGGVEF